MRKHWNNNYYHRRKSWSNRILFLIIVITIIGYFTGILTIDFDRLGLGELETNATISESLSNIVPERLDLRCKSGLDNICLFSYTDERLGWRTNNLKWLDGNRIFYGRLSTGCYKGHNPDENINLIYCHNLHWSKVPIDEEGNVGKTQKKNFDIILDLKDHTEEGYKVLSYS